MKGYRSLIADAARIVAEGKPVYIQVAVMELMLLREQRNEARRDVCELVDMVEGLLRVIEVQGKTSERVKRGSELRALLRRRKALRWGAWKAWLAVDKLDGKGK